MNFRKKFIRSQTYWFWIPFGMLLVGYGLLYSRLFNVLNPDMIAYFAIARHYQALNFPTAFNSYWSPLICWIMAVLPGLHSDPITTFRWINMALGLVLFYQGIFWVRVLIQELRIRFLAFILLVLLILHYSLYTGTPDFLSVVCFFIFLRNLFTIQDHSWKNGFWVGVWLLLSFFSKSFLLPLCVSLVGLVALFKLLKEKQFIWRPLLSMLTIVLSGLLVWATCLKAHYGIYTLGSSFAFNSAFEICEQFVVRDLPYEQALFMWEDPYYLNVKPAYFWSSFENFNLYLTRWKNNLGVTVYIFKYFSYLWLGLLLIPILGFLQKPSRRGRWNQLMWMVFVLNWFGYFLVLMLERYLTIGHVAICLSVFGFLDIILKNKKSWIRYTVLLIVFISLAKNPIIENWHEQKKVTYMRTQIEAAEKLAASGILKGEKVATFTDGIHLYDYIALACYYGNGHYLGETRLEKSEEAQREELIAHGVSIVMDSYAQGGNRKGWLNAYPVIYRDEAMNVLFYKIAK